MSTALLAAIAAAAGVVRAVVAYLEYHRKRAGPEFAITADEVRRFLERLAVVLERLRVQLVVRIELSA